MYPTSTATFTTKQNKILFLLLILCIVLQACQKYPTEPASQELLAGFRLSLEQRFQKGDTLPYPWKQLQLALPERVGNFVPQQVKGGTFSPEDDRFSAVSQFFTNEEGEYLFIKISDYAADSSAISYWLNRRQPIDKMWIGETESIIIEDETSDLIRRKSAIRGSRFLISLATNHSKEDLLNQALNHLNWNHLP